MSTDQQQGQEPQRCVTAVRWPADPRVWLLDVTDDAEAVTVESAETASLRSAEGWASVVDAYQRASKLAGLVSDLVIEAGFTVGLDGDVRAVLPAVSAQGAPQVRIQAANAQRVRAWLSSGQDVPVPSAVSPPSPAARPPGGGGHHHAA